LIEIHLDPIPLHSTRLRFLPNAILIPTAITSIPTPPQTAAWINASTPGIPVCIYLAPFFGLFQTLDRHFVLAQVAGAFFVRLF
jgi:hypothetical protein